MSGSETGVNVMTTTNREPFNSGGVIQKSNVHLSVQNMSLAFSSDGTAVYKPITPTSSSYQPPAVAISGGSGSGDDDLPGGRTQLHGQGLNMNVGSEQMKRKRGRPRKYGPDGSMSLALVPFPSSAAGGNHQSGEGFSSPRAASAGGSALPTSMKKSRGRPLGSGRKRQLEALGSAGVGFTPHVITVKTGEDVSSKIMSFSQHGPRAVCILSANGAISNVTLRQAATSGGTVTYEILSLSGSFLLSENGGQRSRTGGLSVSLSGPDGRVLGGGVAGLLTAATPVQVVVGTFIADDGHGRKESKSLHKMEPSAAPPKLAPGSVPAVTNSPPSHGALSESSGGPGSPLNQSTKACINNNNHQQGMATSMPWK